MTDTVSAAPDGRSGRGATRRSGVPARILDAARELFAQQGYHATGVAELGRTVGLGSGALYHHIGSKEELLFTILREHLEDVLDFGRRLIPLDLPAADKLRELGREHMRMVATRRLELLIMLREVGSLSGQRRQDMLALRDAVEDVWMQIVTQGQRSGELDRVDAIFVKVALGALNYSVLWYHADGASGPDEMGVGSSTCCCPATAARRRSAVGTQKAVDGRPRRRARKVDSATAMTTAAPLKTGSTQSLAPASVSPLTATATKKTPVIVPGTLNWPGRMVVAPGSRPPAPSA